VRHEASLQSGCKYPRRNGARQTLELVFKSYLAALISADSDRRGDLDSRGNLSAKGLGV